MSQSKLLVPMPMLIVVIGCAEEAPTDRIRVSGHVEATEVRLAPEAGGRILTLTVKDGDRVQAAARPEDVRQAECRSPT